MAHDFSKLQLRTKDKSASLTLPKKVRWVLADKDKFEGLVRDLAHFGFKLYELLPKDQAAETFRRWFYQDLAFVDDLKTLRLVYDAAANRYDFITEAAIEKMC